MDGTGSATQPAARTTTTRRGFLVAGGVGVVGGAVGGAVLGHSAGSRDHGVLVARVSAELTAAALAERRLIAGVDVALRTARGARRTALRQVRAGHVAHLHAIEGAIDVAVYPATRSSSPTSSTAPPAPAVRPSSSGVEAAERRASTTAAARALRLEGAEATLLATIAAAEATHAVLLGART